MALVETQTRFSRVTISSWRWGYVWAALAVLLVGAAFWFDAVVHQWMLAHQTPAMRSFMRSVSWWGDWPWHIGAGAAGALIAWLAGSRRWLAIIVAMMLACALAGIVNRAIKITAGRARPTVQVDSGWNGPRLSSKYNAFPSGHTAASAAFFAALCFARPRLGLLFLPIPMLIGISRVYLGAHHLSDVVFAAMLGVICAALVTPLIQRRFAALDVAASPTAS